MSKRGSERHVWNSKHVISQCPHLAEVSIPYVTSGKPIATYKNPSTTCRSKVEVLPTRLYVYVHKVGTQIFFYPQVTKHLGRYRKCHGTWYYASDTFYTFYGLVNWKHVCKWGKWAFILICLVSELFEPSFNFNYLIFSFTDDRLYE